MLDRIHPGAKSQSPTRLKNALIATGAMFFVHGLFFGVLAGFFPIIKQVFEGNDKYFAYCLSALGLGSLLAMFVSSRLVQRFGSKRVTVVSALAICAFFISQAFGQSFAVIASAVFMLGIALSMTDMAMNVQASLVEQLSNARLMTRIHACWSVGGIVGGLLAGLLIERLTPSQYAISCALMVAVASVVATSWFLDDKRAAKTQKGFLPLLPLRLLPFGAIALLVYMAGGGIRDWSAVYLSSELKSSMSIAVQIYSAFSGATTIGRIGGDAFRTRFGERVLIALGGAIGFVAIALGVFAHSELSMFLAVALFGLAHANIIPALISVAGKADPGNEASNVSAIMAMGYVGYALGPFLIGNAASSFGVGIGLILVAVASLLAALVCVVGRKSFLPG